MAELRVPTASQSGLALPNVQQASTAVQISAEAMRAPGKGLASMGQQVGQVGQFFAKFADTMQQSNDLAANIEFEVQRKKQLRSIMGELQDPMNPVDEQQWSKELDSRMSKWMGSQGNAALSRMSPQKKQEVAGKHSLWMEETLIKTDIDGRKSLIQKNVARINAGIDDAVSDMDAESVQAYIENGIRTNVFTEDAGRKLLLDKMKEIEKKRYAQAGEFDPVGALQDIQDQRAGKFEEGEEPYPWLKNADDLDEAENFLISKINAKRSEVADQYVREIDIAKTPDLQTDVAQSPEMIYKRAEADYELDLLSARQLSSIKKSLFSTSGFDEESFESVYNGISEKIRTANFDSMSEKERSEAITDIRGDILAAKSILDTEDTSLRKLLQDKIDKKGAYATGSISARRKQLEKMANALAGDDLEVYEEDAKEYIKDKPELTDEGAKMYYHNMRLEALYDALEKDPDLSATKIWENHFGLDNESANDAATAAKYKGLTFEIKPLSPKEHQEVKKQEIIATIRQDDPMNPIFAVPPDASPMKAKEIMEWVEGKSYSEWSNELRELYDKIYLGEDSGVDVPDIVPQEDPRKKRLFGNLPHAF
jgi:hypothetical protein